MQSVCVRLEPNLKGRDFTVGDIHGCFTYLELALKEANFDQSLDRLICVGDLVNRGPESERAIDFLKHDWFYSVRGNHDDELQQDFDLINERGIDAVGDKFIEQGLGWMLNLNKSQQTEFINAFKSLPYAIEVPLPSGESIGFTHAEIPQGLSWQDFVQKLESGDQKVMQTALWGRKRIIAAYQNGFETDAGVDGISKVFTGHSIAAGRKVSQMGNWFCIDTGAVMRYTGDKDGIFPETNPDNLHLSLINIQASPQDITRKKPQDDARPYHVIQSP